MIITILSAMAFVLALFYCIYYKTKDGLLLLAVLGIYIAGCIAMAIIPDETEWNTRYSGLSSRVVLWNGGAEDPTLWTDVAKYNEDLADAKRNTKNIWVNWISEKDCLNYEPIEIPEYERKG